jgi:hypothetical protein
MKKINIQKIKENEIFTDDLFENINFIELIFNSSYRKIIDTGKYKNYNEFELDLDLIESELTNKILKNKKLINGELIYFKYKNEVFSHSIDNLISNFESKYTTKDINDDDKVIIYEYIKEYPDDHERYQIIIDNFIIFINFLIKVKDDDNNKIDENTKILDIVDNDIKIKNDLKDEFKDMFKEKNDLTVNKISNIYDFYLKLIFKYVKEDIVQYQEKISDNDNKDGKNGKQQNQKHFNEKTIQKLDKIFNEKDLIITKNLLATALRLFISIVLYREKDKENKIKENNKNIVDYLKEKDLWKNIDIKEDIFNKNLIELKYLNIKIKEILWLYFYLTDNKDEDFEKDIKKFLENKKSINRPDEETDGNPHIRIKKPSGGRRPKTKRPSMFEDSEGDDSEGVHDSEEDKDFDSDTGSNKPNNKVNRRRK